MLGPRLLTGATLIAALAGIVMLDAWVQSRGGPPGSIVGALVLLVVSPVLAIEFARLQRSAGSTLPAALAMVAGAGGLVATMGIPGFADPSPDTVAIALAFLTAAAFVSAAARRDATGASRRIGGALMAFVLAGVLPAFWVKIRVDFSAEIFVACVLVVKASDIGAYFGGRLFGRHKLIPWLSPGKTREGLVAGIACSAAVAAGFAALWSDRAWVPSIPVAAIGGAIIAFAGALGDLGESLLKREAGAKDSGRMLPGMGGLFDVLDSLLPAGPVAWILLRM